MATARFWRVIGVAAYGGGDLELSGLHLHDAAGRVDASATLTCSHAPVAGVVSALQDADVATACRFGRADVASATFSFLWDFGSPQGVVTMRPAAADSMHLFVRTLILQSSSDGVAWSAGALNEHIVYPGARAACALLASAVPGAALLAVAGGGAAGSTTFTDLSPLHLVATAAGTVTYSGDVPRVHATAVKMLAGGSLNWTHPAFQWGSNVDYRMHCWLYFVGTSDFSAGPYTTEGPGRLVLIMRGGSQVKYNIWGSGYEPKGQTQIPTDTWVFFEFGRRAGRHYSSINGVVSLHANDQWDNMTIGRGGFQIGVVSGVVYFSELVVETGVPPRTANFTPPVSELGIYTPALADSAPSLAAGGAPTMVAASAPLSAHACAVPLSADMARDVEFGGSGRIWGTTKIELSPGNRMPAKGRVSILRERDKLLAREVWSDPVTGAWEVGGLDTRQGFIALAQDPAGNYMPAAADRTLPEEAP